MTNSKKKLIDNIWMNTKYGKWAILVAAGNTQEANEYAEKVCMEYPFSLDDLEIQMSNEVKDVVKTWDELQEYLKLLEIENYELVDFFIRHGSFSTII